MPTVDTGGGLGMAKENKHRQARSQSPAQWVKNWVHKLLLKSAILIYACAGFFKRWLLKAGNRSQDECAARGAAAQNTPPKGGCSSGAGQHQQVTMHMC